MLDKLMTNVDEHSLELYIQLCKTSKSGYPVYSIDIYIGNQRLNKFYDRPPAFSVRQTAKLIQQSLILLSQWCQQHPNSYVSSYEPFLPYIKSIFRWGFACDGRMETFFTFINQLGQPILYPGVLNPIKDCLDVDDLWRVAKDTDYFLGPLATPVDFLNKALVQAGYRNLLEEGYAIKENFQTLFFSYLAFAKQHQTTVIEFPHHQIGSLRYTSAVIFSSKEDATDEAILFYADLILLGTLTPECFTVMTTHLLDNFEPDSLENMILEIANSLLKLKPEEGKPLLI